MKKKIIVIIIFSLTIILFILYAIFNPFLTIKLKGKNTYQIKLGEIYKENGCKVKSLFLDLSNNVKIKGKVNNKKIGTYKLEYKINYLFKSKKIYRTISVIDTEGPVITLIGDENIEIYVGDIYQELGFNVSDNYDKELEDAVKIDSNLDNTKAGDYQIKYSVEDSSGNKTEVVRNIKVKEKIVNKIASYDNTVSNTEPTYINGILIVNKTYALPSNYNKGVDATANQALINLQNAASEAGYNIPLLSGFRSYETQQTLYNNYVARDGVALADTYSARPGHSEHQTGLAFDVGKIDNDYGDTNEGKWLATHAHEYGFIIRYLKGKEDITGYMYEPWHIRYVGSVATNIYQANITLEEYLGLA